MYKYSPKILGSRIRAERNKYKMTQEELSDMIREICSVSGGRGIGRNSLSKLENGDSDVRVTLDAFDAMCEIFMCEAGYLLGDSDTPMSE